MVIQQGSKSSKAAATSVARPISILVLLAGAKLSEDARHPAATPALSLNLNHLQGITVKASVSVSKGAAAWLLALACYMI